MVLEGMLYSLRHSLGGMNIIRGWVETELGVP